MATKKATAAKAETKTETKAETETKAATKSEQETTGGTDSGCASVVSVTLGVLPLAIAAAFALRKKKD